MIGLPMVVGLTGDGDESESLLMPMEGSRDEDDESLSSSTGLMVFISAVSLTGCEGDSSDVLSLSSRMHILVAFS